MILLDKLLILLSEVLDHFLFVFELFIDFTDDGFDDFGIRAGSRIVFEEQKDKLEAIASLDC